MITQFKEDSSKKLLKELNLDIIPTPDSHIKINEKYYYITRITFDTNNIIYTIWLRKFKRYV